MKNKTLLILFFCLLSSVFTGMAQTKVSILGDSYSTFGGYVYPATNLCWFGDTVRKPAPEQLANNVKKVEQTWWHLLIKKLDAKLEFNSSFSGATICHTGYGKKDFSDRSFITHLQCLGNPDLILVMGGTNDDWANVPLGKYQYKKWIHKDLFHFRPAFAYVLHQLQTLYPEAKVVNIVNCDLDKQITQSMAEICKHYRICNIELKDIDKQGGHPSIKGMQMICDQVYPYVK